MTCHFARLSPWPTIWLDSTSSGIESNVPWFEHNHPGNANVDRGSVPALMDRFFKFLRREASVDPFGSNGRRGPTVSATRGTLASPLEIAAGCSAEDAPFRYSQIFFTLVGIIFAQPSLDAYRTSVSRP